MSGGDVRRFVIGIALAGCAGGDDEVADDLGQVRVCLESDADVEPTPAGSTRRWDVSGTVEAVDSVEKPSGTAPFTCVPAKGRTIDVRDASDHVWRVGWLATSGNVDRTPTLSVEVGDTVDLTFLHLDDFADDSALVIADADGLLLAAEEGRGQRVADVDPGLLHGLAVERGDDDPSLFYESDCGRFTPQALVFTAAGTTRTLGTWEEGTIPVGGVDLQARNVGAYDYVGDPTCTDVWGPMPWMAWR